MCDGKNYRWYSPFTCQLLYHGRGGTSRHSRCLLTIITGAGEVTRVLGQMENKRFVCMQQSKSNIGGFGLYMDRTLPTNDRPNRHHAVFRNHSSNGLLVSLLQTINTITRHSLYCHTLSPRLSTTRGTGSSKEDCC